MDLTFYKDKKVLVTGHTGFKGTWMCNVLKVLGAEIYGFALEPPTTPNLYDISNAGNFVTSVIGDIRNFESINEVVERVQPEIIIHMAAQPLVSESYSNPVYTYETNVMGTVNILESVRKNKCVKSFVNVTTDKVYKNKEWLWSYRENEELNGYDPYSNSKSCSELVTDSYCKSFFSENYIGVATLRAGNVIGGGDYAPNRISPDCVKALINNEKIILRNPNSIRPYQHVLEPVFAYLLIAQRLYENPTKFRGAYNIGPDEIDCVTTLKLAQLFCEKWGNGNIEVKENLNAPHEATFLKLDNSKVKFYFNWSPVWDIAKAVEKTVEWSKYYEKYKEVTKVMEDQIFEYLNEL